MEDLTRRSSLLRGTDVFCGWKKGAITTIYTGILFERSLSFTKTVILTVILTSRLLNTAVKLSSQPFHCFVNSFKSSEC